MDDNNPSDSIIGDFPVTQQLALLALILFLIFGSFMIPNALKTLTGDQTAELQSVVSEAEFEAPAASAGSNLQPLEGVRIGARAAFVWDVTEQRALYQKEADARLPLASITKLMTALLASELMSNDSNVSISNAAIRQDGASGLAVGERFTVESLQDLVLVSSSNDGAFAIASAAGSVLSDTNETVAFVDGMNILAEELGLTQTSFSNPTGLDISDTRAGGYGSARDVTFLVEHILINKPEILEATKNASTRVYNTDGSYHDANNTNRLVDDIPGLIGSKTGYTDLAGGNLTVAFDAGLNRPVIVTVLGSTRSGRFADVQELIEAVNESYR